MILEDFARFPGVHPAIRRDILFGTADPSAVAEEAARLGVTVELPPPPPPPPKSPTEKLAAARAALDAVSALTGPVLAADVLDILSDVHAALGD